jgi:predicted anti-sigma-YlaC factor YlaD
MWVGLRSRQCERARELASLLLDGEVSELEEALLRTHRSRCADCEAFARGLTGLTGELRAAPLETPSRPFALPRRPRTALRGVQFAAAAAAAVAIVAGVSSMLTVLGPTAGQTRSPQAVAAAGNSDLKELRTLRRNELVFASTVSARQSGGGLLNPALETARGPRAHGGL